MKNSDGNGLKNYSNIFFEIKSLPIEHKFYKVKVIVEGDNGEEFELTKEKIQNKKFKM
jgi:hypothetical protein